jgi:hypothetical protein
MKYDEIWKIFVSLPNKEEGKKIFFKGKEKASQNHPAPQKKIVNP